MKHLMPRLLLLAALPVALPAQDLARQIVPADTQFVVSVDLGAALDLLGRDLVRNTLQDAARAESGGKLKARWLDGFTREWGFDPFTDLQGLVLFGNHKSRDGASLALVTSARIDGVLGRLTDMGALEPAGEDGDILQLVPGKLAALFGKDVDDADQARGYVYVHKTGRGERARRALVFGEDRKSVAAAAKAMREGGDSEPRARGAARDGALLSIEVDGRMIGDNPAARLTSKAKRLGLAVVAHDGGLRASLRIDTGEAKDARQIAALVNGIKALAAMVDTKELEVPEELLEAVQEAQARADGKTVTLDLALPRELIDQCLEQVRSELRHAGARHGHDADADEDADETPRVKSKAKSKKTPVRGRADR